jgi:hypothetical protein
MVEGETYCIKPGLRPTLASDLEGSNKRRGPAQPQF